MTQKPQNPDRKPPQSPNQTPPVKEPPSKTPNPGEPDKHKQYL